MINVYCKLCEDKVLYKPPDNAEAETMVVYMTRRDVVYIISVCHYNLGQVLIEHPGNQGLFSTSIMNKAICVCTL